MNNNRSWRRITYLLFTNSAVAVGPSIGPDAGGRAAGAPKNRRNFPCARGGSETFTNGSSDALVPWPVSGLSGINPWEWRSGNLSGAEFVGKILWSTSCISSTLGPILVRNVRNFILTYTYIDAYKTRIVTRMKYRGTQASASRIQIGRAYGANQHSSVKIGESTNNYE